MQQYRRMKITTKLFLVFFLIALALMISNFFSYQRERVILTDQVKNHLHSIASLQQARMRHIVEQNIERLQLVASRTQLRLSLKKYLVDNKHSHQVKMNHILTDARNAIPSFKKIEILTLDGKTAASTDNGTGKVNSANYKKDVSLAKEQLKISVTNIFIDQEDDLILHLSGPLYLEGKLLGVIRIDSRMDNIITAITDYTGLGKSGETILATTDKNGGALFLTPTRFDNQTALKRIIPAKAYNVPAVWAVKGEKKFFTDVVDYRGAPVLAATDFIEETGWGLVVKIDQSEAFAPLNKLRDLLILVVSCSIIAIIFSSVYLIRSISLPIANLTEAAMSVSQGGSPVEIETSTDEIGILANSFNTMTKNLTIANTELYKNKKEWERTFDAIGDIVTVMNGRFQIIKANRATYKMLNLEPGTLEGKFCYEVFSNKSSACENCPGVETRMNYKVCSAEIKHEHLQKDFLITTSPVPDENGNFTNIIHIAKDITKIREAEEERIKHKSQILQARNAGMAEMASEVLHNIGNAITPAHIAALNMLRSLEKNTLREDLHLCLQEFKNLFESSQLVDQEEKNSLAQIAEKLPEMVGELLDDYLANVKQISDKHEHIENIITLQNSYTRLPGYFEVLELSQIIDDALQMMEESIRLHKVKVVKFYDRQEKVRVEKFKMIQIMINLIKNCQEATYQNPVDNRKITIHIFAEPEDPKSIVCSFKDNGCGFCEKDKSKLFSFGYTSKKNGCGLGLHSCANYLNTCNGTIEAYSDGPDSGAEFIVKFPVFTKT